MLLRGRNTVGYTPYPVEVTDVFVREATAAGLDIFRIFDALNDVAQMRPAIEAVCATGRSVAEVALCYTGDLSDPGERLYTLDYYLRLAEQIVDAGAHVLAIKDMAGLLRPPAARTLVRALRERFDLPVHLHTHDTPGGQLATLLAAIDAGVDAVDAATASMAGTTSQPALSALVAGLSFGGVAAVRTARGTVQMLKFSMDALTLSGVDVLGGRFGRSSFLISGSRASLGGHVVLYTTKLSCDEGGTTVTFTPKHPPTTLPPDATYTHVVAGQLYLESETFQSDWQVSSTGGTASNIPD